MSEARPLPSHTTTGMGGSSLRLSSAMEITLGPPSTIRHTRGTPWPKPGTYSQKHVNPSIYHWSETNVWERNVKAKHVDVKREQTHQRREEMKSVVTAEHPFAVPALSELQA